MKLTQIIKGMFLGGVLAVSAGCSYPHIPDSEIKNVESTTPDAEWTKKYRNLNDGKSCVEAEKEPFDLMTPEELVHKINTPFEAQVYCFWLVAKIKPWEKDKPYITTSLQVTHKNAKRLDCFKTNDCTEMALAAATLLYDNGYKPLILRMTTGRIRGDGHHAFIYKKDNKFHTVDSNYEQRDFPEGHDSVNELIKKQFTKFKWYNVFDMSELHEDWQTTKKNMHERFKVCTERVK